ncbi:MAG TPA: glycosyltransferase [Streptosporangiaceae bacterium]
MDSDTKQIDESTMFGGSPARILRLSAAGRQALGELRAGPVRSVAAGVLARRLTDAGLANPCPPPADGPLHVTVVIPVRDRPILLDRCLAGLGRQYPVIVVDDGSADPAAVAEVAARHGARLIARDSNGGAGAARNTGLAAISADPSVGFIAFLDSDCLPAADWISQLAAHLADPQVGAVAPRVVAPPAQDGPADCRGTGEGGSGAVPVARWRTAAARYAAACGSLDLGDRAARVAPGTRVSYVPTAALLVRREALADLGRQVASAHAEEEGPFDPGLRYGEDVDLVWRLHEAGWRIRYDPSVQVMHRGPETWTGVLARRFRYGTSAGPLATRHPANLAPLVLQPWPAAAAVALLARRPLVGAAAVAGYWLSLSATLRRAEVPADGTLAASIGGTRQTWLGMGRYATQFAAPAVALGLARPGGRRPVTRWGRRAALASLLLGPALTAYRQTRPRLHPVTFTTAHIADDVSYGAGVWAGSIAERTAIPLRPALLWRPLRFSTADAPAASDATAPS